MLSAWLEPRLLPVAAALLILGQMLVARPRLAGRLLQGVVPHAVSRRRRLGAAPVLSTPTFMTGSPHTGRFAATGVPRAMVEACTREARNPDQWQPAGNPRGDSRGRPSGRTAGGPPGPSAHRGRHLSRPGGSRPAGDPGRLR